MNTTRTFPTPGKTGENISNDWKNAAGLPWSGLFHLFVVYIVWGGTYLAIRFAVREGSGFPPFAMAASRVLLGGLILLTTAAILGHRLRITRREFGLLVVSAIFLWNGGNGLVTWAEQRANSGYAALVVGSTPIWTALIEALADRRRPSSKLVISLLIGFAGLAALTEPVLVAGTKSDWLATLALVAAPISWSIGSIIQQRNPVKLSPVTSSAYQQLLGCVGFTVAFFALGEPLPSPTMSALFGWGYLVIFGSVLAFTSFVIALQRLPVPIVMTYAYVNPVIAVLMGWLLLGESITRLTILGMVMILLGVAGVFHDRFHGRRS